MNGCIVAHRFFFQPPAPNIEHFPTGRREWEERLFVEAEQTQQEPAIAETASATSVTYFGNHVERSHNNNQALINHHEVTICVCGNFSWVVVKMYPHNFYPATYCIIRECLWSVTYEAQYSSTLILKIFFIPSSYHWTASNCDERRWKEGVCESRKPKTANQCYIYQCSSCHQLWWSNGERPQREHPKLYQWVWGNIICA